MSDSAPEHGHAAHDPRPDTEQDTIAASVLRSVEQCATPGHDAAWDAGFAAVLNFTDRWRGEHPHDVPVGDLVDAVLLAVADALNPEERHQP